MLARLRFTIVNVDLAISSGHSVDANARIVGNAIDACRTGRTRIAQTLVDIVAAVFAIVSSRTEALEIVHFVDACRVIFARLTQAFVDIEIAQCAGVTRFAIAFECARRLIYTNAMSTNCRRRLTFVDVDFAIRTIPTGRTLAVVFVCATIMARCAILARALSTTATATANMIRTNAFTILACHRLLTICCAARFQAFASFAIITGRTNANRTVWTACAAIETCAIVDG